MDSQSDCRVACNFFRSKPTAVEPLAAQVSTKGGFPRWLELQAIISETTPPGAITSTITITCATERDRGELADSTNLKDHLGSFAGSSQNISLPWTRLLICLMRSFIGALLVGDPRFQGPSAHRSLTHESEILLSTFFVQLLLCRSRTAPRPAGCSGKALFSAFGDFDTVWR